MLFTVLGWLDLCGAGQASSWFGLRLGKSRKREQKKGDVRKEMGGGLVLPSSPSIACLGCLVAASAHVRGSACVISR